MRIQHALGSDIVMAFDECTPHPATHEQAADSMRLSMRWAQAQPGCARCPGQSRTRCSASCRAGCTPISEPSRPHALTDIGFPGYAIGGLAVGESREDRERVLADTLPHVPAGFAPRYLMGVGKPEDIVAAVRLGIDMFDCVLPTRNARNDYLYTPRGDLRLRNARFRDDLRPVDERLRLLYLSDTTAGPISITCRAAGRFSAHGSTRSTICATTRC